VPVQWWRSVGHSHTGFATEVSSTNSRPSRTRIRTSSGVLAYKASSTLAVLDLAAQKAGWSKPLPKGRARGIAVHFAFESYNAQVAEVSVTDGRVRVIDRERGRLRPLRKSRHHRSPVGGRRNLRCVGCALSGTHIRERASAADQFPHFPVMRMNECPEIETHIVENNEKSGGIGAGVPCTARLSRMRCSP